MGEFSLEPLTGSEPSKEFGIEQIPEEGEIENIEGENTRDLDPTLLGKSMFYMLSISDMATKTMRKDTAENLVKIQQSRMGKWGMKVGSGALKFLERTQGSMVAGQTILIRSARGEGTADLLTPLEIIGGWDFRDPELEALGQIAGEREDIPGQRQILQEILTEEQLKNLQETPFNLFGLDIAFDSPTDIINNLLYKEYVIPETGESRVVLSQEQVARFVMNLTNDAFLPFAFAGTPVRGVRGVRNIASADEAGKVAKSITEIAHSVPKSVIRGFDDIPLKKPLDLKDIPIESIGKATGDLIDFRGTNPTRIWEAIDEGVSKLDPKSPEDVLKFKALFDELAAGQSAAGDLGGMPFAEGLDYALSSHKFTDMIDRVSAFGERAGLTDISNIRRFRLSDSLAGASITQRPTAILPDGRVLFYNTHKGEDFSPMTNPNMHFLYRSLTGRSNVSMTSENAGFITSKVLLDKDEAIPTLALKLRVPDITEGKGFPRENIVDQFQETIAIVDAASRASKHEIAKAVADARRIAREKAEYRIYKSFNVTVNEREIINVGERRATLRAGRNQVAQMAESDRRVIQSKIIKRAEKAALKAETRAANALQDDTFNLAVVVDTQVLDDPLKRKLLVVSKGNITSMLTKENRDLRGVLNAKMGNKGTVAFQDPETAEIKFANFRGKGTTRRQVLRTREQQMEAELKNAIDNPSVGNKVGPDQGLHGTVDEAIEGLMDVKKSSKADDVVELDTEFLEGSGGGKPPKGPPPEDVLIPPTSTDGPSRIRDMTIFGWIRDPERVLAGTGIFDELLSAEHGLYRTQEAVASVMNSRLHWLRVGSDSARRIGRVMAGKTTDVGGEVIKLTDQEDEGMRLIKTVMDHMMVQTEGEVSDDIRDYFAKLMIKAGGRNPKIDPSLLETPITGNAFYGHLLPPVKGTPQDVSYDIAETFRTFVRQAASGIHMDPAIRNAKKIADDINLPPQKRRYLNTMLDRMQGKPTRLGRIVDEGVANALEKVGAHHLFRPIQHQGGVKFILGEANYANPASRFSLGLTRQLYRGMLGGSISFMEKNLAQNLNTIAEVGPWHTMRGAAKLMTPSGFKQARSQKLVRDFNAIFEEEAITSGAIKSVDDFIFAPVRMTEFFNRGVGFHAGMSAEASRLGKPISELLDNPKTALRLFSAGHTVAQRTQFIYGTLGRSPVFGSGLGRVMGQFMTFPIKQSEFLSEMVRKNASGFTRFLGISGYYSRILSEAGVDPTGFVGFGFVPQGIEPGVPLVLPAGFQGMYHAARFSNALATGDLRDQERWLDRMQSDIIHLVPVGLQAEKMVNSFEKYQSLSIESDVGELIRPLSDRERIIMWSQLPTVETRMARDLASDMMRAQKLEQFQRSLLVRQIIDYAQEKQEQIRKGDAESFEEDSYWNRLSSQAVAWGLPINAEDLNAAAERRELSTYLRRMMRNKRMAVQFWNRYITDIPGEAEELGLQPINFSRDDDQ